MIWKSYTMSVLIFLFLKKEMHFLLKRPNSDEKSLHWYFLSLNFLLKGFRESLGKIVDSIYCARNVKDNQGHLIQKASYKRYIVTKVIGSILNRVLKNMRQSEQKDWLFKITSIKWDILHMFKSMRLWYYKTKILKSDTFWRLLG